MLRWWLKRIIRFEDFPSFPPQREEIQATGGFQGLRGPYGKPLVAGKWVAGLSNTEEVVGFSRPPRAAEFHPQAVLEPLLR